MPSDIVVIGASAGGVEALRQVVAGLTPGLHASLFVVLHVNPVAPSHLARILQRAGPLPAEQAVDGEPVRHGHIYVAAPDRHLLLERGRIRVLGGPRENSARPAVDPLFRSAAWAYGPRVLAIVLSGMLDDGAAGLRVVKRFGGLTAVQDPRDAVFEGMPVNALESVSIDYRLPAAEIGPLITQQAQLNPPQPQPGKEPHVGALDTVRLKGDAPSALRHPAVTEAANQSDPSQENAMNPLSDDPEEHLAKIEGEASGFTCPECNGSLWEAQEGGTLRFECRVSHRYTFDSLVAAKAQEVEASIWAAVNALEERAALMRKQGTRSLQRGLTSVGHRFMDEAVEAEGHAEAIRRTLLAAVDAWGHADPAGSSTTSGQGSAKPVLP